MPLQINYYKYTVEYMDKRKRGKAMRPLIIALGLYICMMSWMLYNDHRTTTAVHEAMTTIGFHYYITWVSRNDRTPKAAIQAAEAWAMKVDPKTVDAVNVRQWVKHMKTRRGK